MLRRLIDYIAFRTTQRYNVIKVRSLEPNYWDKDTLLLHAVMQLVVDFVEVECAFMEHDRPFTLKQKLILKLPWFFRTDEVFRSREDGLKHLDMLESFYDDALKDPSEAPKVIKEVYLWWKDVRPLRQDPGDESGFNAYMQSAENTNTQKSDAKMRQLLKKAVKIEQAHFDEDTRMLKKIIEVRAFLWT